MTVVVLARSSKCRERLRRMREVQISQIDSRVDDGDTDPVSIGWARCFICGRSHALDSVRSDLTGRCDFGNWCWLSADANTFVILNGVNLAIGNDIFHRRLTLKRCEHVRIGAGNGNGIDDRVIELQLSSV